MHSEEYAKYAIEMREWLNSQPHLPKDISDNMLCRFAHSCYFDMDKAKRAAESFFTLRRENPQLYTDRDPNSPHMQNILKAVNLARFDISENRKIWFYQLVDPQTFDIVADAKLNFLVDDCWFLENEEIFYENDVYYVVDVKDLTYSFFWRLKLSVVRAYSKYQREATPIRVREIHFVNSSPMTIKAFALFRHLLSRDLRDSIHFHEPNSKTLLNFFDKDELPADFGGSHPPMAALMAGTTKLIEDKRDTVLRNDFWMANIS